MTPVDRELLELVLAEVRGLRADLARRRDGHDPAADGRLVLALVAAAGSRAFAAPDVLRHAAVDSQLHAALQALGLQTARQVGHALRRVVGRDLAGFSVQRIGRDERGALWSIGPVSAA